MDNATFHLSAAATLTLAVDPAWHRGQDGDPLTRSDDHENHHAARQGDRRAPPRAAPALLTEAEQGSPAGCFPPALQSRGST
jgi:hypothetical protein